MPELPDLEVFTANLHRRLAGKTVHRAEYHKAKRLNVTPDELHIALAGKTLDRVFREGKGTILRFGDTRLGIHLMLKGEFSHHAGAGGDKGPCTNSPFHRRGCAGRRRRNGVNDNYPEPGPSKGVGRAGSHPPEYPARFWPGSPAPSLKPC